MIFLKEFLALGALAVIALGCSTQVSVTSFSNSLRDFEKTEILVGSPVFANGNDELIVVVHLKNSDSSSVPNYKPLFDLAQLSDIQFSECTTSDLNGISVCRVKSIVPGLKTLTLTNAKVGLSKTIEFMQPQGSQRLALLPGSLTSVTSDQYKVQINAGNSAKGVRYQTPGGYSVLFALQGVNP